MNPVHTAAYGYEYVVSKEISGLLIYKFTAKILFNCTYINETTHFEVDV
jgi:hypothetical protein